jgi:hypothetical protein
MDSRQAPERIKNMSDREKNLIKVLGVMIVAYLGYLVVF